jgi:hypothetical protein
MGKNGSKQIVDFKNVKIVFAFLAAKSKTCQNLNVNKAKLYYKKISIKKRSNMDVDDHFGAEDLFARKSSI